jgi:hypothetical protein
VSGVDDPPDWLHVSGECDSPTGSLELSDPVDSLPDSAAAVANDQLSEDASMIARFAVHRGGAVTCSDSGGTAFQRLLGCVSDHAVDPYRETHGVRPRSIFLETSAKSYEITALFAFDAVLV